MGPTSVTTLAGERVMPLTAELPPAPRGQLSLILGPSVWARLCWAADAVVLLGALGATLLSSGPLARPLSLVLACTFPILALGVSRARSPSHTRIDASALDALGHAVSTVSIPCMLMIVAGSALGLGHPLALPLRLWPTGLVLLTLTRTTMLLTRRWALRSPMLGTPTLIVGAGRVGERLVHRLLDPRYGMRPVGFLDSDPLPPHGSLREPTVPVLGGREDLAAAVAQTGARQVILAFAAEPDHTLPRLIEDCQRLGLGVALVPRLFESVNDRAMLDHVGGLPLLQLAPTNPLDWRFTIKHTLDRTAAAAATILLAPLLLVIALAVRGSSPGPILFRQLRVGRDGRPFQLLKFRTMRLAAGDDPAFEPAPGHAPGGIEGADRRTRIGSLLRDTSLDELPQLINVLRGEMSIVGPRPERPEYVGRFSTEIEGYAGRHRVKAGITGWAQVNGLRGQTSIADRAEWDNYYIRNWSMTLDLRILARTAIELLRPQREPLLCARRAAPPQTLATVLQRRLNQTAAPTGETGSALSAADGRSA
jgi:exopolysaccharide biosynthesis polyprenyl glycosylphosphotransferase